jgi:hypothetical protein
MGVIVKKDNIHHYISVQNQSLEIIRDGEKNSVYVDIDGKYTKESDRDKDAKLIEDTFKGLYYILKCNRKLKDGRYKLSYHLIHKYQYSTSLKLIYPYVKKYFVPEFDKLKIPVSFVDGSVYNNNRFIRCINCIMINGKKSKLVPFIPIESQKNIPLFNFMIQNTENKFPFATTDLKPIEKVKKPIEFDDEVYEEITDFKADELILFINEIPDNYMQYSAWIKICWAVNSTKSEKVMNAWVEKCKQYDNYEEGKIDEICSKDDDRTWYSHIYAIIKKEKPEKFKEIKQKMMAIPNPKSVNDFLNPLHNYTWIDFSKEHLSTEYIENPEKFHHDLQRVFGYIERSPPIFVIKGKRACDEYHKEFFTYYDQYSHYKLRNSCLNGTLVKFKDVKPIKLSKYLENINYNGFKYDGIMFLPTLDKRKDNMLNTFSGLRCVNNETENNEESAKIMIDFIKEVICNNDEKANEYLIQWLANMICNPVTKTKICCVLYGNTGVGKSTFTRYISHMLLGKRLCEKVEGLDEITKTFNKRLRHKLFTTVEEASNIKKNKSYHGSFDKLKELITGDMISIEAKYMDSCQEYDYNNYIINTNNSNSVKVEYNDRRYFMLKVSDKYKNNRGYFKKIISATKTSSHAFYKYLTSVYDNDYPLDIIPDTKFRSESKQTCMPLIHRFMIKLINTMTNLNNPEIKYMVGSSANTLYKQEKIYGSKIDRLYKGLNEEFGVISKKVTKRLTHEQSANNCGKKSISRTVLILDNLDMYTRKINDIYSITDMNHFGNYNENIEINHITNFIEYRKQY